MPIFGLLWGLLIALLAILDPTVAMILSIGSLMLSVFVLLAALVLLSARVESTLQPNWNILTINCAAAALCSLAATMALAILFSNGVLEFEIMPVPT